MSLTNLIDSPHDVINVTRNLLVSNRIISKRKTTFLHFIAGLIGESINFFNSIELIKFCSILN